MPEAKNLIGEPGVDGPPYLVKFAGKKMIDSFNHREMIVAGESGNQRFNFFDGAVFVVSPVHKKFGLVALAQEREIRSVDGNTQADQVRDARILAAGTHANPGAKTESRKQQRHPGKLGSKKVQPSANIVPLSKTTVVDPGAQPCTAKIEPQHRDTEAIQRLRRLVNHFVVHRAAK